jgi:hypothetical protein
MRVAASVRVLGVGVAAASLLTVPLAAPATAAKKKPHVTCSKLNAPKLPASGKLTSKIASCKPATLKAGGSSVTKVDTNKQNGTITQTIKWKNKRGTTRLTIHYKALKKLGKCKAPYDSRVKITGTVKSSTGKAAKIIKKGEPVSAFVCAITTGSNVGKSALEPGTKFKL